MATTVRDVMTGNPVTLPTDATVREAASLMKEHDIGDVLVTNGNGQLTGIVTDRDIVVRSVAEGGNPAEVRLADVCSGDLYVLSPDDSIERALELERERAVRRIPVVDNGRPVGVLSIGDLAVDREPESVLAEISAADPNE